MKKSAKSQRLNLRLSKDAVERLKMLEDVMVAENKTAVIVQCISLVEALVKNEREEGLEFYFKDKASGNLAPFPILDSLLKRKD